MSGDRVTVDTEGLRRAGRALDNTSAQVDAIYTRLNGRLTAAGRAWGDDKMGNEFAGEYEPNAAENLEGVRLVGQGITSMGEGLVIMAENYEAVEEAATEYITGGETANGA